MIAKELIKLILTTILLPLLALIFIGVIFIAIHESIWKSREREVSSEQREKI